MGMSHKLQGEGAACESAPPPLPLRNFNPTRDQANRAGFERMVSVRVRREEGRSKLWRKQMKMLFYWHPDICPC